MSSIYRKTPHKNAGMREGGGVEVSGEGLLSTTSTNKTLLTVNLQCGGERVGAILVLG